MGSSHQDANSLAIVKVKADKTKASPIQCDDLDFLMYFIMGIYFGPDLRSDSSQKSALQRIFEGLPPYNPGDLAGSKMKMVTMENLYYFVLRKAEPSVVATAPLFKQFLSGKGSNTRGKSTLPQFTDLFPPELHPQSTSSRQKVIENVAVVYNPNIGWLNSEDIERFQQLTGMIDFSLDCNTIDDYFSVAGKKLQKINEAEKLKMTERLRPRVHGQIVPGSLHPNVTGGPKSAIQLRPKRHHNNIPSTGNCSVFPKSRGEKSCKLESPAMMFFPSPPSLKEWNNVMDATKTGIGLAGSAAMGPIAQPIGRVDIAESQNSYYFRVSLPGVKRNEREFSCEVSDEGMVFIQGIVTTGEESVTMYSQVFKMLSRNLGPPGNFSFSFHLPGPINPNEFEGSFGVDGVLEGIVTKKPKL